MKGIKMKYNLVDIVDQKVVLKEQYSLDIAIWLDCNQEWVCKLARNGKTYRKRYKVVKALKRSYVASQDAGEVRANTFGELAKKLGGDYHCIYSCYYRGELYKGWDIYEDWRAL